MRQRVTYGGNFSTDGEGKFTKFYSEDGSYEVVKDNITGKEKHVIYIGGTPYESNIVYLKDFAESSGSYKFLHKDYIGSILAISDEAGNKLEQRHFDAWGNFTHLQIGNGAIITDKDAILNLSKDLLVNRGYTSHEHFLEVGIIHMNGRLYDPLLRRFLNADENIQDPYYTQNYNKYGYVFNNPLMYNDPNGEFVWFVPIIAAVVSEFFTMYYTQTPFNGARFVGGLAMSYASAGIAGAIGTVFKTASVVSTLGPWGTIAARAGAHALTQGIFSTVQGGSFWGGALSGAFASVSGDLLGMATDKLGTNNILRSDAFALFNGAVSGGVGSALGGGNFWMGAGQGLVVTAFNFLAHRIDTSNKIRTRINKYYNNTSVADAPVNGNFLDDLSQIFPEIYELSAKNFAIANEQNLTDFNNATGTDYVLKENKLVSGGGSGDSVNGVTSMEDGSVLISPHRMRTALGFAATWYHEGIHSIHTVTGMYQAWKTKYGVAEAIRITEFYAHSMTDGISGVSMKSSYAFSSRYYPSIYIQSLPSLFLRP